MLVMFFCLGNMRSTTKLVWITNCLQRCRGGPVDLPQLLGLVRAELWAELQLDLGRDLIGCSPPTTLKMPRVKLREQSAGLYLRASQLSVARQLEHD